MVVSESIKDGPGYVHAVDPHRSPHVVNDWFRKVFCQDPVRQELNLFLDGFQDPVDADYAPVLVREKSR